MMWTMRKKLSRCTKLATEKRSITKDYSSYVSEIHRYYLEFLSRSVKYQAWLKEHSEVLQELEGTSFKLLPAKIVPGKKRKPLKPHELKKPVISPSGSRKGQGVWDRTNNFICDSNRVILEINIEKPIELLKIQFEEITKAAQEKYWEEMNDQNWFGEYRYLTDFKRDSRGRRDTYPFEEWDRYLEVFDFKQKHKDKTYKEITKLMFDSDKEEDVDKVKKDCKKARLLIKATEENKFPPKKLKISSKQ